MSLSSWDNDYRDGLVGESLTADIIQTAEVKTDYQWQKTGNFYIEYECWYNNDGKWKPSGSYQSAKETLQTVSKG